MNNTISISINYEKLADVVLSWEYIGLSSVLIFIAVYGPGIIPPTLERHRYWALKIAIESVRVLIFVRLLIMLYQVVTLA